jgi:hypothetical protein
MYATTFEMLRILIAVLQIGVVAETKPVGTAGHAVIASAIEHREELEAQAELAPEWLTIWSQRLKGMAFVQHINYVGNVPYEYGWEVYYAALGVADPRCECGDEPTQGCVKQRKPQFQGNPLRCHLDPYDLAALLVSENSGPDLDMSIETAKKRQYDFDYDPKEVAKAGGGERGLFQIKKRWVWKASDYFGIKETWTKDDLFKAEINIWTAAYVWRMAFHSHMACERRRYNYHSAAAHFKCAPKDRDTIDPRNFCRFKQKKFEKMQYSFTQVETPDLDALGKAHNKRMRKLRKKAEHDWKRKQKRARKRARKAKEHKQRKIERDAKRTVRKKLKKVNKEVEKLQKKLEKQKRRERRRARRQKRKGDQR